MGRRAPASREPRACRLTGGGEIRDPEARDAMDRKKLVFMLRRIILEYTRSFLWSFLKNSQDTYSRIVVDDVLVVPALFVAVVRSCRP